MGNQPRIYILGAACSGVTTLGAGLSERFGLLQLDTDDFFWMPTDPPFTTKRPPEDRVRLIQNRQSGAEGWILSGSCTGWGDVLVRDADLIVFLETPTAIRLERLDRREVARYGARILPGADMHKTHLAFRDWASRYDDPAFTGRSLARHLHWLSAQSVPVLRLWGERPRDALVQSVAEALLCV